MHEQIDCQPSNTEWAEDGSDRESKIGEYVRVRACVRDFFVQSTCQEMVFGCTQLGGGTVLCAGAKIIRSEAVHPCFCDPLLTFSYHVGSSKHRVGVLVMRL